MVRNEKMRKDEMRKNLIDDVATERILEESSNIAKTSKRETSIACYLFDLIESKEIGLGYQFGIKRFNSRFIEWENGKATAKASAVPSVKEISNACKSLYERCEPFGFFPVIKTNIDGAIIIDCVEWVEGFYTVKKTTKKTTKKTARNWTADLSELPTSELLELQKILNGLLESRSTAEIQAIA